MANTGLTEAANFVRQLWDPQAQIAYESMLVVGGGDKVTRYSGEHGMDRVNKPLISNLSASSVSAGAITATATTEDKVTLTINKHYYAAVEIEDIVNVQTAYNLVKLYSARISYALKKQTDTDLMALTSSASQSVGTAGVPVSLDVCLNAVQLLDTADVPEESRNAIFNPKSIRTMLKLNEFVNAATLGAAIDKSPLITKKILPMFGINHHFTNQVTDAATTRNVYLQKEGWGLAIQTAVTLKKFPQQKFTELVAGQVLYGVVENRDSAVVQALS